MSSSMPQFYLTIREVFVIGLPWATKKPKKIHPRVLIKANNKSYVFYDGVLKGTSQASQGLAITGGKIMVNRSAYTSVDDQFGDGLYDDIRVSNYVRYTSDFAPPGELGTSRQALIRNYTEGGNDADLS